MKNIKNKGFIVILIIVLICSSGFYAVNIITGADKAGETAEAADKSEEGSIIVSTEDSNSLKNLYAANETANTANSGDIQVVNKDETVYVNLNNDGSVSKINVVNYFKTQGAGIYQDFGSYDNIVNLTNEVSPVADGDSIRWDLSDATQDFYYQGQLKNGELPWTFTIEYSLNGTAVNASELAGASGDLTIMIKVSENEAADVYFRKNYMMQISVPLDMQNSTLLSAPGAVQMIAGHTKTLAFTVLPQAPGSFEIKANVKDFSMAGIDIAMMTADISSYIDADEMTDGFNTMADGMGQLTDGTLQLKDGISQLSGGIGSVSGGLDELSQGTPQLSAGMEQFDQGLNSFAGGLDDISSGSAQMKEGLQGLADNGKPLLSGYQEIDAGLTAILANKDQISAMAGEMAKNTDPQTAMLGQAILGQLQGLTDLETGLSTLNTNLDQYLQGVGQAAGQYNKLNSGISALPKGFDKLTGGYEDLKDGNEAVYSAVGDLNNGLSDINTAAAQIPDQVQKLADGQKEMKNGVDQAIGQIKELTGTENGQSANQPVSFAAPGKVIPNSVQFVLRTAAIEKPEVKNENAETDEDKESFWDRLIGLFQ